MFNKSPIPHSNAKFEQVLIIFCDQMYYTQKICMLIETARCLIDFSKSQYPKRTENKQTLKHSDSVFFMLYHHHIMVIIV